MTTVSRSMTSIRHRYVTDKTIVSIALTFSKYNDSRYHTSFVTLYFQLLDLNSKDAVVDVIVMMHLLFLHKIMVFTAIA